MKFKDPETESLHERNVSKLRLLTRDQLRILVDAIYGIMNGREWNADTCEEIAILFSYENIMFVDPNDVED